MSDPDWGCPICSLIRVKYGANCPTFPSCENNAHANITDQWFLNNLSTTGADAIGIAAIMDGEPVPKEEPPMKTPSVSHFPSKNVLKFVELAVIVIVYDGGEPEEKMIPIEAWYANEFEANPLRKLLYVELLSIVKTVPPAVPAPVPVQAGNTILLA